jgi:hypothetical protein
VPDIVRLSIVYDTGQAAQQLAALNERTEQVNAGLSKTSGIALAGQSHIRGFALAGVRLASVLNSGNISAVGLAGALSRLASTALLGVIGALTITIINVVNALDQFKKITEDVTRTIDNMQTAARDAKEDVARLLGEAPAESNAEKAIKRLRDAAEQLRREAARIGGPAGKLLEAQAGELEGQIPGVGARAAKQRDRDAAKKVSDALRAYNQAMEHQGLILALLNAGPIQTLEANLEVMRKRFEDLINSGVAPTDQRVVQLANALKMGAQNLEHMKDVLEEARRKWELWTGSFREGLLTIGDEIANFVTTGTFAFATLIDNLLRLMIQATAEDIVGGIMHSLGPGPGDTGKTDLPPIKTSIRGDSSIQMGVTFNVQAMDSQSVAAFFDRNGPAIAAQVASQANRSRAMRRIFLKS